MKTFYRNSKRERFVHWTHLIATALLFFTGLTWYWPWLARLIGGYRVTMLVHRAAALVFIAVPLIMVIINWKGFIKFIKEITHWTMVDTKWMALFPLYVLTNTKTKMPLFEGKYNPGQKFNGGMTIGLCALLGATGLVWVLFPGLSPREMVLLGWLHRMGAIVLLAMLGGHVVLGSGLYKPYRGMARTMFRDGCIDEKTARKIWPAWAGEATEVIEVKEDKKASETGGHVA
ncbi:MAG: cytochrome b/b6 domain-containing protein [Dethiobacter sp.]|jgi:formate dehydrogenase subunit gamma|nr:cytochrome b/b6 domain-containing protein [Dethiobacter sp.]